MSERKIWFNGEFVDADQAKVSVYDHGLLYGDGVFEGIRVYNNRVLKLKTHLKRLWDSARAIQLKMDMTTEEELAVACREAAKLNGIDNGYIRLCVTRGSGTLGLNPFLCPEPNIFIIADTITLYPAEMYENGMAIVTAATIRNHPGALSPRIKSLNYLNNILAKIEACNANVPEALMLNHQGFVAECTADNVFMIKHREGQAPRIVSPPSHAGVLEGVTMQLVIELAEKAGMPVERTDITRYDLYTADEALLTGTAAEVMPVTKIDGREIGDGQPGKVTRQLIAAFKELVKNAPED